MAISSTILRQKKVWDRRGVGKTTHYSDISAGLWTRPIPLGARTKGWPEHEVDIQLAARIAGLPDEALRELVTLLEGARTSDFQPETFSRWISGRVAHYRKVAA